MTSSPDDNGHGTPPGSDPAAFLRASPRSANGHVPPAEPGSASPFDPAYLAGLANELFAEGRPGLPGAEVPHPDLAELPTASPVRGVPQRPTANARPFESFDFADLSLFRGVGGESRDLSAPPPQVAAHLPAVGPSEAFYFLPQAAPPGASPALANPAYPAGPAHPARSPGGSAPAFSLSSRTFHPEVVRQDFPILQQRVHGKPLIWLDNAATTQKPRQVIDALTRFYERDNSNIHRAAHTLAARATGAYEGAREKVRRFLGAAQVEEIIFVHGATEAINLVAQSYGKQFIGPGDEIVLTTIEHHANIVPWQHLAREKGAVLRVVPVNDRGEVILEAYERLLGPRTRLVAMAHVSNALGTVLPVRTMIQQARRHGARVLVDGAQSAPHLPVDVQALDCDFYVLAGHKTFGPTGIGALYGKRELLDSMPPWQGGGNMIDQVSFEETTYQQAPARFEAGTGILAGAVGLGAAIDYLDELGMENLGRYEHELLEHATEELRRIPGLRLIGTAAEKASVISFVLEGVRSEDVGRYLDHEGIAVRAGHHCAQPTMRRFGVPATVRPSLAFYNTHGEIDTLVEAVRKARASLS